MKAKFDDDILMMMMMMKAEFDDDILMMMMMMMTMIMMPMNLTTMMTLINFFSSYYRTWNTILHISVILIYRWSHSAAIAFFSEGDKHSL